MKEDFHLQKENWYCTFWTLLIKAAATSQVQQVFQNQTLVSVMAATQLNRVLRTRTASAQSNVFQKSGKNLGSHHHYLAWRTRSQTQDTEDGPSPLQNQEQELSTHCGTWVQLMMGESLRIHRWRCQKGHCQWVCAYTSVKRYREHCTGTTIREDITAATDLQ